MTGDAIDETKIADLERLIELFNESDWEEMHLRVAGLEVFLSHDPRAPGLGAPAVPIPAAAQASTPMAACASDTAPWSQTPVVPAGMFAVRAPNLGTFYRAPRPGAQPYVERGQRVADDTEICLIEVMKLFTPVRAGVSGVIREICVTDGQMVEFEQVLAIIEPAG